MTKKLTLTVDENAIKQGKRYAKESGRSLSDLVEHFLKSLGKHKETDQDELPEVVASMVGAFESSGKYDKEAIKAARADKHK